MNTLLRFIFIFLILVGWYHILSVWVIFGIELTDSRTLAMIRDGVRAALILFLLYQVWAKKFKKFFDDWGYEIFILFFLSVWAVWFSRYQWVDRWDIIIWYKYNIRYFTVALSAVFLWHTALKHKQKYIESLWDIFYRGIWAFLIWWLVYQGLKIWLPDLFMSLWYGPVGDYAVGANPPIWYRTGPWWEMRLQWIFSWPNNYGYFLVAIFSFLLVKSGQLWNDDKNNRRKISIIMVLYVISLFRTLSRWAYIWVAIQILILWLISYQKLIKQKYALFWIWAWWLVWLFWLVLLLSYIKSGSTNAHINARVEWRNAFLAQPRWYGLGTSGPSIHHDGIYLPESQFLQIMIDIGILWFLFWIIAWKVLLMPALEHLTHDKSVYKLPLYSLLWLGLIGLLVVWFFLHSLEDSMVNYLILIPFGILLGMSRDGTHL